MEISFTLAMAKRPGVSATFHFIAVKDQRLLLYIIFIFNASFLFLFFANCLSYYTYFVMHFQWSKKISGLADR